MKSTSFPRLRSAAYGLLLPAIAARLIFRRPSLLLWSALPVALTLSLYFFLIRSLQSAAKTSLLALLSAWGWNPQGWAAAIVLLLIELVLVIAGALTFSLAASIVASPFNDLLAEQTEKFVRPALPAVERPTLLFRMRTIFIDVGKSAAATAAGFLALLLSWIPVVNAVAVLLAFLLFTFQYISYPQTRRGLGLLAGAGFLLQHPFASAGFGAALAFLFAIPILSCLIIPLAVVGGTLLVARAQAAADGDQGFRLR